MEDRIGEVCRSTASPILKTAVSSGK